MMLLAIWVWLVAMWPAAVMAHGGGTPQITDEPVGPYRLFVWSDPDPPLAGEIHFTVAVLSAPDPGGQDQPGEPVLGADVQIRLLPEDPIGRAISAAATHEKALNKLMYETDLRIPAAGAWEVSVSVEGEEGFGDATYTMQVAPARSLNWLWVGMGGVGLLLAIGLVGLWRNRQSTESGHD
jgi:hypothetical protein